VGPGFVAALAYLRARLAQIGPDHVGQDLWIGPTPFDAPTMAQISGYSFRCDSAR
jgi:hypothetical protein